MGLFTILAAAELQAPSSDDGRSVEANEDQVEDTNHGCASSKRCAAANNSGDSVTTSRPSLPGEAADLSSVESRSGSSFFRPANGKKTSSKERFNLRKGKWSQEEEEYASKLIFYSQNGLLPLPEGVTLRGYLAERLNCDPMRITKKIAGASCLAKRVSHFGDRAQASPREVSMAKAELDQLESRFKLRQKLGNCSLPLHVLPELCSDQFKFASDEMVEARNRAQRFHTDTLHKVTEAKSQAHLSPPAQPFSHEDNGTSGSATIASNEPANAMGELFRSCLGSLQASSSHPNPLSQAMLSLLFPGANSAAFSNTGAPPIALPQSARQQPMERSSTEFDPSSVPQRSAGSSPPASKAWANQRPLPPCPMFPAFPGSTNGPPASQAPQVNGEGALAQSMAWANIAHVTHTLFQIAAANSASCYQHQHPQYSWPPNNAVPPIPSFAPYSSIPTPGLYPSNNFGPSHYQESLQSQQPNAPTKFQHQPNKTQTMHDTLQSQGQPKLPSCKQAEVKNAAPCVPQDSDRRSAICQEDQDASSTLLDFLSSLRKNYDKALKTSMQDEEKQPHKVFEGDKGLTSLQTNFQRALAQMQMEEEREGKAREGDQDLSMQYQRTKVTDPDSRRAFSTDRSTKTFVTRSSDGNFRNKVSSKVPKTAKAPIFGNVNTPSLGSNQTSDISDDSEKSGKISKWNEYSKSSTSTVEDFSRENSVGSVSSIEICESNSKADPSLNKTTEVCRKRRRKTPSEFTSKNVAKHTTRMDSLEEKRRQSLW
eukprot:CAMPEP_0172430174 /NCGR_PEP_ID=MMETSP1064-20121228/53435_1 /TAXON_ID=202472 /ORGANISM="Aulacoseira subarctica , Strain CCAP 1002/5" /LENGTH=766 /DNA_ID=CAMNT_0013176069 /DNA_START=179 /DNA_END=2476 /DNA_ORIENTATION=-